MKLDRKSGFTILESIIYISISLIIITIGVTTFMNCYKSFSKVIEENRIYNQVYNTFNSVEMLCNKEGVFEIGAEGDKLVIYEALDSSGYKVRRIFKSGNELKVFHYVNYGGIDNLTGNNPMLKNIEGFKVYKKDNILYLVITKGGEEYIKCI